MSVKIGADPEFFLLDTETGKHVSAFNMIPGTKRDPHIVEGGAVQVDGMALEFNIDAASSWEEFDNNIKIVLRQLREMVPVRYKFSYVPVAEFGQEYIDAQPEPAKELGCDPDYNAWTGSINPKPDSNLGIRTASGHIHIGWTEGQDITHPDHIEACQMMTKQLDFYLGLTAGMWDFDTVRRKMYGDFGAYRPKHYGVEYRTLSNAWVADKAARRIVYDQAVMAFDRLMESNRVYEIYDTPQRYDNHYTNTNDLRDALFTMLPFSSHSNQKMWGIENKARPHAVDFKEKTKNGWFFHRKTYQLVAYDDLTKEMYDSGSYTTNNSYANVAKSDGLPLCLTSAELTAARNPMTAAQLQEWYENHMAVTTASTITGLKKRKKAVTIGDFVAEFNN